MQSSGRRSAGVQYRYYRPEDDEEATRTPTAPADEDTTSEADAAEIQAAAAAASSSSSSSAGTVWFDQVNSRITDACSSSLQAIKNQPAVTGAVAAGVVLTGLVVGLVTAKSKSNRNKKLDRSRQRSAQLFKEPAGPEDAAGAPAAAAAVAVGGKGSSGKGNKAASAGSKTKKASAPAAPGPNSKVKPSPNCVALSDGSAVVVRRPIAADNSCLFNAVGYAMHHSTNRAPFLRQVVSREVSSDPQEYSDAFLGMSNAAYCAWITEPAHWGGGIELAILAAHYRREIAAWNLATGACHVFGEERGFTKQVMVIYNGVHYDVLAIAASPRADQDDDSTEFNPRTKRGKMILAAAQQLVQLNRKGKPSHQEQQQQKAAAAAAAAVAAGTSTSSKPAGTDAVNGPAAAAAASAASATADGSSSSSSATRSRGPAVDDQDELQLLVCGECGEQLQGVDAARAHAAATGHTSYVQTN